MNINKPIITVAGILLAVTASSAAVAQAQESAKPQHESQRHSSANSPAIGQAVSGHNATAAGVSGTGLRTDGSADTGSAHTGIAEEAAGVNSKGQVTGKSTAVIGAPRTNSNNVNAQATNTTSPNNTDPDAAASGGRGKAGTQAEKEVVKANSRAVHEVPGDRLKTDAAVKASQKKHAKSKHKGDQKAAAAQGANGS